MNRGYWLNATDYFHSNNIKCIIGVLHFDICLSKILSKKIQSLIVNVKGGSHILRMRIFKLKGDSFNVLNE